MILKESLARSRRLLAANDIEEAFLEGELLLRKALNLNQVQLYQSLYNELEAEQQRILDCLIERRLRGEPIAYINGYREFYGLDFYVNQDVLIPRPESEHLVEKVIELASKYKTPSIADIGSGCGAIAISLALNLPQAQIYATDISAAALKVARLNRRKHDLTYRIILLGGDLLKALPQPVDIIVANLPYVRQADIDNACFEPRLALDGGAEGLDQIRRLCHQTQDKLLPGGCLTLEIGQGQRDTITSLLEGLYPQACIEVMPDLSGIDRVVSMTLQIQ
jgi:release factor glutamine methyltransferase